MAVRTLLPVALVVASATTPLFTAPAVSQPAGEPRPRVSIFATQSQEAIELPRTGATVTVVTDEDIRERGDATVADALRHVPGINVSSTGNRGALSQVRIRGGEANHTLVVIDGVAANSPDNGDFDFSQLPVADIERIEVIRGPQSGIFGPNAHAGVVFIQTKGGRGLRGPVASATVETGSHGTHLGSARIAGGDGTWYGALSFQGATTLGTNISRFGSERDPSGMTSAAAQIGFAPSEALRIEGNARIVNRQSSSDPQSFFGPQAGFVIDGPGRSVRGDLIGSLAMTTRLLDGALVSRTYVNTLRADLDFFAPFEDSFSTATRTVVGHRATWHLPRIAALGARQSLTGLVEHTNEHFTNDAFGRLFDAERRSTAIGGEYRLDLDSGFSFTAAARNDFNDRFADAFTWRLTGAYTFASTATTIRAAAGRGVTNPTFYEQFGFFPNTFIGNPNLKPESSVGFDLGLRQALIDNRLFLDITYFRADLTDVISPQFLQNFLTTVVNLNGTTKREGFEVAVAAVPVPWLNLNASYTYTETRDPDGLPLIRRPRHAFAASAVARLMDDKLTASVNLSHIGRRDDLFLGAFPATRIRLQPYTLVGGRIAYRVDPRTEIFLRGENLLNVRYEDVFSYRATGATIFAGMTVRLGE